MYFRLVNDELFIKRCFELAELGKGLVAPNPLVGAVLVYDGNIIGEGWHKQYGEAHAEVNCLESVSDENKHFIPESTMYVNLEPCAHHGKTPPCAVRLVEEKVKKVVIANIDPYKEVAGKGKSILKNAGIEVVKGVSEEKGKWLNRRFFCYNENKRPYIILKWAQTQNGLFAPLNKSRFQISNKETSQLLHKWRTEESAIMVGYTTAKNDNPELTARLWNGTNPLRIVLDEHLELPRESNLFNNKSEVWVVNNKKEEQSSNIKYVRVDYSAEVLPQLMNRLYETKVQSLIVEGGAVLLQSFIKAALWDEARVFEANTVMENGLQAPTLINAKHIFSNSVGSDKLQFYTNMNMTYPYIQGLQL